MSHDLIVFDLDGTLVDSEPLANRVFHEKLAALGLDPAIDEARLAHDFTGLSLESCFRLAHERYGLALPPGFRDDLQAETFRRLERDLQPIPGAEALLSRLRGPRCVASSSESDKIAFSLRRTNLARFFSPGSLFSAQQVQHGKPAPDLFLFAAQTMGAVPEKCVVVEDSLPGATAGIRAGMQVFAFRPQPDTALDAPFTAMGCRLIRHLDDLQAFV
ncbi:HAD family hydrolase [Ferrovibrio sp.]|uniref:HAD family hydrolase n=1 Tax=Ferrovibrio sp. TaxID=1917215 RepID=UPI001B79F182|nr:HAD family hydrolase [Ferrovibrio sp.]MBP7066624.1 HAD family hydrolase [Ferrovibrio sp.]